MHFTGYTTIDRKSGGAEFPTSQHLTAATDATLPKEGRMHFTGYTTIDRKSGQAEGSAVRFEPGDN
jgi:hypothetical protein